MVSAKGSKDNSGTRVGRVRQLLEELDGGPPIRRGGVCQALHPDNQRRLVQSRGDLEEIQARLSHFQKAFTALPTVSMSSHLEDASTRAGLLDVSAGSEVEVLP